MVLSDNLGKILAGHFRSPISNSAINVTLKDTGGVDRVTSIYITNSSIRWNNGGMFVRIGKGTTPATAQDIELENPFSNPPESNRVGTFSSSYIVGSGQIQQASLFSNMGASDSITEVVQQIDIRDTGNIVREIQLSRIIINPPVAFLLGQAVNLVHEMNI